MFDLHRDIEKDPPHSHVHDRSSESGPCFSRNMMSSLNAKPGLHRSVSEWTSNNQQLSVTAQHERHISNVIRQEGRTLRNETNFKVGSRFVGRAQRTRTIQQFPFFLHTLIHTVNKAPFLRRHTGMRPIRVVGWVTVFGMLLGGRKCWKLVLRKWMKRWRLWHWWFIQTF